MNLLERAREYLRRTGGVRNLLDAWALIGLPALYAGLFMGIGGMLLVFGRLALRIPPGAPQVVRVVPYFLAVFLMLYGFWLLRRNFKHMEAEGYLDILKGHWEKRKKKEG